VAIRKGYIALPVILMLAAAVGTAFGGEQTIRLKDYINHAWSNELVTYQLTFKAGECRRSSIELVGPGGPAPFQLSEVKEDGRGFVNSARLSFITDLPALGGRRSANTSSSRPAGRG